MSPWITKNGKRIPINLKPSNSDKFSESNLHENYDYFDDEEHIRKREEFARLTREQFEKEEEQSRAEKKQARFDKVFHLNLGYAKGFLINATPALIQLDPTLSSVYTSYKVAKYGYCFLKQVNEDYQTSGNYEESLKTVAKQEVEEKITSKIKAFSLEKGSQYAANRVWTFCKETYSDGNMDAKWDRFGERALAKTFEEVGSMLL